MLRSICCLFFVALAACPPPGEGPLAERAYVRAGPIIDALERFRTDSAYYPDSLSRLTPHYLADSALAAPNQRQVYRPWRYIRTAESYTLTFEYAGPGMNQCTYQRIDRRWQCSGYY